MDYRKVDVWQRSRRFVASIYEATKAFPAEERFDMTSQIRRAAVSIAANIAEGSKKGQREYARYLRIAEGSAGEVECLLILAGDVNHISPDALAPRLEEIDGIQRMLASLRSSVEATFDNQKSASPRELKLAPKALSSGPVTRNP